MQLVQVRLPNDQDEGKYKMYFNYEFAYLKYETMYESRIDLPETTIEKAKNRYRLNYSIENNEYITIGEI